MKYAKVWRYRGNLHVGTGVGVCIVVAVFEDPVFCFFNRSGSMSGVRAEFS